jgi:hypothetical protein
VTEVGWFERQQAETFEFLQHFDTVDEWLRHRQARRSTSILAAQIVDRARKLLAASPGEVRVYERVLATVLRRLNRECHESRQSPAPATERS